MLEIPAEDLALQFRLLAGNDEKKPSACSFLLSNNIEFMRLNSSIMVVCAWIE